MSQSHYPTPKNTQWISLSHSLYLYLFNYSDGKANRIYFTSNPEYCSVLVNSNWSPRIKSLTISKYTRMKKHATSMLRSAKNCRKESGIISKVLTLATTASTMKAPFTFVRQTGKLLKKSTSVPNFWKRCQQTRRKSLHEPLQSLAQVRIN